MRTLVENQSELNGTYDGDPLELQSTIAETEIVTGLTATKTASKALWSGGTMTYTVTIENDTEFDFETPIFTDTLDSNITLVPNSITVGGVTHAYTYAAQLLTINLDTIPANSTVVVTFDVSMA